MTWMVRNNNNNNNNNNDNNNNRERERENWELPSPEAGVETDLEIAQSNFGANHNWCIRNCLERYRKMVRSNWCHMSFGIIVESILTGCSKNSSQSLRHLRLQAVIWCLRKTPASHPEAVFNEDDDDDDDDNNNNNNNNNTMFSQHKTKRQESCQNLWCSKPSSKYK